MPNRILREGIVDSRAVNSLSEPAEILYRRLMSIVDDYGRYDADPDLIRARCFPLQLDRWPTSRVSEYTTELHDAKLVTVYRRGEKRYLQLENFGQRLQSKERYPSPTENERKRTTASHGEPRRTTVENGEPPLSSVITSEHPSSTDGKDGFVENKDPRRTTVENGEPPCRASRARTNTYSESESESESYSDTQSQSVNGTVVGSPLFAPSARFDDWWQLWSSVKGTSHRMKADAAYKQNVPTVAELDCFECTASYLQSLDNPARGYHPENFLTEQALEKFKARWPVSRSRSKGQTVEELAETIDSFRRTRNEM